MQFISSDTNIWLDFENIGKISLPFRLDYIYLMEHDAIEDELLSPPDLGRRLTELGLKSVEMTMIEFSLAEEYGARYKKLSTYDRVALSIAKCRKITLMTGDLALRKAAEKESVNVLGTLGIMDQLAAERRIDQSEYRECIQNLSKLNGGIVRLPEDELARRLQKDWFNHLSGWHE